MFPLIAKARRSEASRGVGRSKPHSSCRGGPQTTLCPQETPVSSESLLVRRLGLSLAIISHGQWRSNYRIHPRLSNTRFIVDSGGAETGEVYGWNYVVFACEKLFFCLENCFTACGREGDIWFKLKRTVPTIITKLYRINHLGRGVRTFSKKSSTLSFTIV